MTDFADKALLPAGVSDVLPPGGAVEARVVEALMSWLASFGFERVKPPLIEFEESLLAGGGASTGNQTFRLMDPVSQRMMVLRTDITLQVARIATTRMGNAPRPLRLGYAGQVLRVMGTQLRPERQFAQVGAELIGSADPGADIEVITVAVSALEEVGVSGVSVDLGLPTLVPAIMEGADMEPETAQRLRTALDRKDAADVKALTKTLGKQRTDSLLALLAAVGPAEGAVAALGRLKLSKAAAQERDKLVAVVQGTRAVAPDMKMTVDPVENRGFEYHTGVTFTLFAKNVRGELGSGGRYLAGGGGEPATGFTLFMDSVLRALPAEPENRRIYVPAGASARASAELRAEGWVTIAGLGNTADPAKEAKRLRCGHVFLDGEVKPAAQARKGR